MCFLSPAIVNASWRKRERVSRPRINNRAASAVAIIQFTPDNRDHRISILQAVIKLKIFSGRSGHSGGSSLSLSLSPRARQDEPNEDCDPLRSPTSRICSPNLFLVVAGGPSSAMTYEGTYAKRYRETEIFIPADDRPTLDARQLIASEPCADE